MNADELDAAREAVSASRTWRNQMRADWGTSFREPEEVLDEAVGELLAEQDRLRAVVRKLVAATGIDVADHIYFGAREFNAPNDLTADELAAYRRAEPIEGYG